MSSSICFCLAIVLRCSSAFSTDVTDLYFSNRAWLCFSRDFSFSAISEQNKARTFEESLFTQNGDNKRHVRLCCHVRTQYATHTHPGS